jgi:class 3 adenylate cyclase
MTVTRYVTSADGTTLAVTLSGDENALPIVWVRPWATSEQEAPGLLLKVARHRRVISYNRRGTGASSGVVTDFGIDGQVADLFAVSALAGANTFDVVAFFDAGAIAIAFAARYPERVRKLVLWQPLIDGATWLPADRVRGLSELARTDWTLAARTLANLWSPRASVDRQRVMAKGFQQNLNPETLIGYLAANQATNVADEARLVRAETLILHPIGAGLPARSAQQAASLIPRATLQSVEQEATYVDEDRVPALMLAFLDGGASVTSEASASASASSMAVILFVDIADSTGLTERLGDAAFRDAARVLDEGLGVAMRAAGGSVVEGKVMGDGLMAVFASASQAVDAARRCVELSATSELRLHVGVHAGDVIREKNNVFGGAVNIAARVCGETQAGQILVSATVRELARTSTGVRFEDRGEHALKGIDDPIRLYEVTSSQ